MWTKIEIIPSDHEIIYLPSTASHFNSESVPIIFGGKEISADVEYNDDLILEDNSCYENPGIIRISTKLKDKLLIQESLTYQIKLSDSSIIIGPVIGLLLGIHTHRYNPKHMGKYSDRFGSYNKVGGLIYAFSPKWIDWKKHTTYGLFYNIDSTIWEYGCFPLPEVIYRRDFHSNPKHIKKLIEFTKGRLFNSHRFTKFDLYNYINENEELSKYLPPTELSIEYEQIKKFIDKYQKVIMKPVDLSRGRGICIIEKTDLGYKLSDYRYKTAVMSTYEDSEALENFFNLNQNLFNKYLIQKFLSLARIENSLFDVRVVMQKNQSKIWQCTGIECRVSCKNSLLTNISRGGYALSLDEALHLSFDSDHEIIANKIMNFSNKFCEYMDKMGHHFAEFGLDVAIDINKNIWLIEANVFPSFKGFKKMDRDTYLDIRHTPLLYALSLTDLGQDISKHKEEIE